MSLSKLREVVRLQCNVAKVTHHDTQGTGNNTPRQQGVVPGSDGPVDRPNALCRCGSKVLFQVPCLCHDVLHLQHYWKVVTATVVIKL